MSRKTIFSFLVALLLPVALQAAIPDMKFRRLDTRNGLSNSQVNCVYRDSRGFVWLGTAYGLNRYDGYRFRTFYSNKRDTTSMRDNYTDQIMEDYQGKLWLKQGMNYCVYDPVTEQFERNVSREVEKFLGKHNAVERVYIDAKKNFWLKFYEEGIFYYNPKTKKTTHIKMGYGEKEFKPHYGISTMADYGDCVIATTNTGQMVCMNGEKGTVEWENTWMHDNGGLENQDYKLFVDQQGNFWVTTLQYTFIYMRKEDRWYKTLPECLKAQGYPDLPDDLEVWDVKVDQRGWIWVATDHRGLYVIDPKSHEIRQFLSNKFDESTISDNTTKHISFDNRGQAWIGTYKNGVNQYQEGLGSIRNIELGDINTVTEDARGNYWIGTNDHGIIVYNPATGEQTNYTTANSGLSGNIMVGSCTASDGSVWFGSYNGGLVRCIPNGATATVVNYRATGAADALATNNVWSVTEDKWHRMWIATLGGGIQQFDPKTGKFRTWNTKNTKLPSDYLTSVSWIKSGWLMVGTSWYWCLVNPVTGQLAIRMPSMFDDLPVNAGNTVCVVEDSRGLIWQGSASGVLVYDQKRRWGRLLDMTDGLFGSSICSVLEDKEHMMWVITDHGVSKVIPERQADGTWQFIVRSYNSRDGLQQGTYNQRSAFLTHDGLILIGGQDGLDIVNPKALSNAKSQERPVFSGLQIFDVDVPVGAKVGGRVILREALDVCRTLKLRFDEQFTIQLASDAGNINNGKRFAYRLEGFNDNWVKTSELNPNITYNSLRAGSYTLRVRMLNDDGTYSDEESTLSITIQPPLWRTRWMIMLYMLAVAAAAWLWRRWFIKHQLQRLHVESIRREMEKKQWMNEMRQQMADGTASVTADDTPQVELHCQQADLVSFIHHECDSFEVPEGKSGKVYFLTAVKELDISFDGARLSEAIDILLQNSVRFSVGECRISVGVARTMEGDAQIQVADNGVGIRDEYKAHVFEHMPDGDGIGLDRVKDIIVAHGGTIRVDDNPGGGTIFFITLPAPQEPEVEEAVLMDDDE